MAPEKLDKALSKIRRLAERKLPLAQVSSEVAEAVRSWRYYYGDLEVENEFRRLD